MGNWSPPPTLNDFRNRQVILKTRPGNSTWCYIVTVVSPIYILPNLKSFIIATEFLTLEGREPDFIDSGGPLDTLTRYETGSLVVGGFWQVGTGLCHGHLGSLGSSWTTHLQSRTAVASCNHIYILTIGCTRKFWYWLLDKIIRT